MTEPVTSCLVEPKFPPCSVWVGKWPGLSFFFVSQNSRSVPLLINKSKGELVEILLQDPKFLIPASLRKPLGGRGIAGCVGHLGGRVGMAVGEKAGPAARGKELGWGEMTCEANESSLHASPQPSPRQVLRESSQPRLPLGDHRSFQGEGTMKYGEPRLPGLLAPGQVNVSSDLASSEEESGGWGRGGEMGPGF